MPGRRPTLLADLRGPFLFLGGVLAYGVAGFLAFGHTPLDALARTALVITTVGFTAQGDPGAGERVFTASVAVLGVVAFLVILGAFGFVVAEGGLTRIRRYRKMQRRIDSLKDHFIVCAYGRVGRAVARELEAEAVPFVVIDKLDELEDRMRSDGVRYLIDDPTHEGVLRLAGIDRARALVTAVDSDADNVYITLTARSIRSDLFIVARASESAAADRLYRAGANRVISPYVSSGRHMAMLALRPRMVDYLEVAGREHDLRLEEIIIERASRLHGRRVGELGADVTPLLIRRADGETISNPDADITLIDGDLLVVLGEPKVLRRNEG